MTRATRTAAGLFALTIVTPIFAHAALVDINTADAALLDTLPGIGPSKAAAIVDYRAKNGLFATTTDIQNVSGIGPVTFAHLKTLITVGATGTLSASGIAGPVQPPALDTSYTPVKAVSLDEVPARKVEPITNVKKNIQAHEQAVIAPTAAVEPAAVGAALPPVEAAPAADTRAPGLFRWPWTLGLLGVVALAGGAFVFL